MTKDDKYLQKVRISELNKWRKAICDEFEKWPMFYTSKWFIEQISSIDTLLSKLKNHVNQ